MPPSREAVSRAADELLGRWRAGIRAGDPRASDACDRLLTALADRSLALSPRETEVLQLLADGLSSAEIGRTLWISTETVKHHRKSIHLKLDARTSPQAVAIAYRKGLIR